MEDKIKDLEDRIDRLEDRLQKTINFLYDYFYNNYGLVPDEMIAFLRNLL